MSAPAVRWLAGRIPYTGRELRSHWIRSVARLRGDALVAFRGGCDVPVDRMVDLEDVERASPIFARDMLHFLGEFFEDDLERAVLRQRLLMAVLGEEIRGMRPGLPLVRRGDDLYVRGRKLTVSIATASPVSTLLHAGVNVDPRGAPVAAVGLGNLRIAPEGLARRVLARFREELATAAEARVKVRPVP